MTSFTGRTVTGAAGGIGGHDVTALVAAGADVVASDVAAATDAGTELAGKATAVGPGRAVFVPGDITSDADWEAVVGRAVAEFDASTRWSTTPRSTGGSAGRSTSPS